MTEASDLNAAAALAVFCAASFAAAVPGLLFRPGAWYRNLRKPAWRPPDWLFGPVWLVLYAAIAVAGWIVWQQAHTAGAALALTVFAVQLLLNGCWSIIFFGCRRPDWAFFEILLLWLSIAVTIAAFYAIDPVAALLLLPYLAWVTFAVLLNHKIWRLNAEAPIQGN